MSASRPLLLVPLIAGVVAAVACSSASEEGADIAPSSVMPDDDLGEGGGGTGNGTFVMDGSAPRSTGDAGDGCVTIGASRSCTKQLASSSCTGVSRCTTTESGEFATGSWGPCDCDVVEVRVDLDGDCVKAKCPPEAPHPVGCQVTFSGGDDRGCVARTADRSEIFFKEGNVCDKGKLTGTIFCSSAESAALDAVTCTINKKQKFYVDAPSKCPQRDDD